jgi:predicted ArsR family transcriptional regulator
MERPASPSEITAEATERLSEQQIRTAIEKLENEDFIQTSASAGRDPKRVRFAEDDCSAPEKS